MRRRRVVQVTVGAALLAALGVGAVLVGPVPGSRPAEPTGAAPAAAAPVEAAGQDAAGRDAAVAAAPAPGTGSAPVIPLPPQAGRDLVRTARMAVEVGDPPGAAQATRDLVARFGGVVANETVRDGVADLTIRVPADQLDRVLAGLAGLGAVAERSVEAEDVTERVVDLETRLATQRASVARVRALLERATTISEVVEIESELTRREAELESLQARAAALSSAVAMSTVRVEIRPLGGPGGGGGFLDGLAGGWDAFLISARALLMAAGAALPFLVLAALGGAIVVAVRRRLRLRKPAAVPDPAEAASR